jgi:hypothetical protein
MKPLAAVAQLASRAGHWPSPLTHACAALASTPLMLHAFAYLDLLPAERETRTFVTVLPPTDLFFFFGHLGRALLFCLSSAIVPRRMHANGDPV